MSSFATRRMDFDFAHERMVVFESSAWGQVARTWAWVDDAWSLRRTANVPPPRDAFAFAYDPARHRFVLFSGTTLLYYNTPGALLGDTWEYDGVDWSQRFPPTAPPPQIAAWMGFDYSTQKLLLCGGTAYPGLAGAWHFDGSTWTAAAPAPFHAYLSAVASDPVRQRIVAQTVDGVTGTSRTLEWDGTAWLAQQPTLQAPPHNGNMTFVARRGTVVMHGVPTSPSGAPADLWEWNGAQWTQIAGTAPPYVGEVLVDDPVHRRTFTFSATDVPNRGHQTWQWDGTNWTSHEGILGWEVLQHAAYDFNRSSVVAMTNSPLHTVAWDGRAWHVSAPPPGAFSCEGVAFDVGRGRLVAVGRDLSQAMTWEHDGVSWLPPTAGVPATAGFSLLYHIARGRVVLCLQTGLFEWTGAVWNWFAPGPGVLFAGAVYDQARNEIVAPPTLTTPGGWPMRIWDGVAWQTRVSAMSPPPRTTYSFHSLGYDVARQRVVLFGGRDPVVGTPPNDFFRFFNDLWEWDGFTWTQRVLTTAPQAREAAAVVFDPVHQHLLLLGGNRQEYNGAYKMFSDVWVLDATASAAVNTIGPGCGGVQIPQLVNSAPHPGQTAFTVELQRAAVNAPALFLFALGSASLPIAGGCTSYVGSPDQLTFCMTNSNGFAYTNAAIPLGLQGFVFSTQAAVLDASAPLGVALTQGLRITVGR